MTGFKIHTKYKLILCIIALLTLAPINAQKFNAPFQKYGIKEGLSETNIRRILEGHNGFIWIATQDGLNRFDGNEFKVFKNNPKDSTSVSDNIIVDLAEDQEGNIWVATATGGICKYNPVTEQFSRYQFNPDKSKSRFSSPRTGKIYKDQENNIWVSHPKGIEIYDPSKDKFNKIAIKDTVDFGVFDMVSATNNNLWLSTNYGIKLLDTRTFEVIKTIAHDPADPKSMAPGFISKIIPINNDYIWALQRNYLLSRINTNTGEATVYFKDPSKKNPHPRDMILSKTGELWLATEFSGIGQFDQETGNFNPKNKVNLEAEDLLNYPAVNLMEDSKGNMWVSSWGQGLIHYNNNANHFGYKPNILNSPSDLRTDSFREIFEDNNGNLWAGTAREGLVRFNPKTGNVNTFDNIKKYLNIDKIDVREIIQGQNQIIWVGTLGKGLIKINPETFEFKVYFNNSTTPDRSKPRSFHFIKETNDGKLWLASRRTLTCFDPDKETSKIYTFDPSSLTSLPAPFTMEIYEDPDYNLWISFYGGGFYQFNREKEIFSEVKLDRPKTQSKPYPSSVSYVIRDKNNLFWMGSTNGLLKYNPITEAVTRYTTENGLVNNTVNAILQDKAGNLWISTLDGISKFNPNTEVFKNYKNQDGLQQSEFIIKSAFKSKKTGLFYFGGSLGLNYFFPEEIKKNDHIPPIVITEFKKYNIEKGFIFESGINYRNNIELGYKEKDFSLKVAALDFANPRYNKFSYKLEGYNNKWVDIGTQTEISFTNLSPGNYTLKVKGANSDGIWNEEGKTINITIRSPWWYTWWAYTLYGLFFIAILYAAYKYRISQLETVRLKELDEAKRTMYTNITHEFRTPLTVISGISGQMRQRLGEKDKEDLDLIDRNSKNMLYLVNQLLELRKLEIGKMDVNYIQGNIIHYLKYIAESFKTYAKTRDIALHLVSISEKIIMDYDPDKILMILSNLLSNAIKYSEPGGDVYMQIYDQEKQIQIRVVDAGKGIPEEKLPYIFDRFYKVENKGDDNIDGIGIGLAVTKELVELLEGKIEVTSNLNKGSIFSITLPIQNKAPLEQTINYTEEKPPLNFPQLTPQQEEKNIQPNENAQNLLIIEDNKDIIQYLKSCLGQDWNLAIATDGQKGIDQAIENVPDIILCDLMMPNTNGYQVLETLKNNENTSHIPIVILTAKADEESRLEAYKKGADVYLLKPFNKEELNIVLQKLTEQRKLLQERFQAQNSLRFAEGLEIHKEDTFIKKLEALVLKENTKTEYSITSLCKDLGMSRTQLHNKIKALTGKSTSIFVRSLRLQKGKYLLEHTSKGISEIAYDVGFNNPSYFTKSFTEEFGIPPSSLRKG